MGTSERKRRARLLARLRCVAVAGNRWVLKGALALDHWLGPGTRTTKDVDLGRSDDHEAAKADFLSAQAADLGGFFVFASNGDRSPR